MDEVIKATICHLFPNDLSGQSRLGKELMSAAEIVPAAQLLTVGLDQSSGKPLEGKIFGRFPYKLIALRTKKLPRSLPFQVLKFIEWTFRAALLARRSRASIIHCHSLPALPAAALASIGRRGTRVLYDAHELETRRANMSKGRQRASRVLERLLIPLVHEILVVSPSIQAHYKTEYPWKKTTLLMNLPSGRDVGSAVDIRAEFGISLDKRIMIYIGVLAPKRGIELMLETAGKVTDWEFVFMGSGPLDYTIAQAAKALENVHIHEPVQERDIVPTVAQADLSFCVIDCTADSYRFALPNKFFQSLTAGVPTLVNKENVDMLAVGAKTGMVHPVGFNTDEIIRFLQTFRGKPADAGPKEFLWENQDLSSLSNSASKSAYQDKI